MQICNTRGIDRFLRTVAMLVTGIAVAGAVGVTDSVAADPAQEAHDTYCIVCHDTSVYTRSDRLARDYDSLREQVFRWQSNIALGWSDEEIDRMTNWLAKNYYRMRCPTMC
jgi:hypothetical protein